MSDLLNKYIEAHDQMIALLIEHHRTHLEFIDRQSYARAKELRKVLKLLRLKVKETEQAAQARMHERRTEWRAVNRLKKDKEDEC
jgi:uncharacterized protein (DUF305 family)